MYIIFNVFCLHCQLQFTKIAAPFYLLTLQMLGHCFCSTWNAFLWEFCSNEKPSWSYQYFNRELAIHSLNFWLVSFIFTPESYDFHTWLFGIEMSKSEVIYSRKTKFHCKLVFHEFCGIHFSTEIMENMPNINSSTLPWNPVFHVHNLFTQTLWNSVFHRIREKQYSSGILSPICGWIHSK